MGASEPQQEWPEPTDTDEMPMTWADSAQEPQAHIPFLQAVSAAAGELEKMGKDQTNSYLKSKYQSLNALYREVQPVFRKYGLVLTSQGRFTDGAYVICTRILSVHEHDALQSCFLIGDTSSLHKIGGSFTFGVRYNLYALLGIFPEGDDDGNVTYQAQAATSPQLVQPAVAPLQPVQPGAYPGHPPVQAPPSGFPGQVPSSMPY